MFGFLMVRARRYLPHPQMCRADHRSTAKPSSPRTSPIPADSLLVKRLFLGSRCSLSQPDPATRPVPRRRRNFVKEESSSKFNSELLNFKMTASDVMQSIHLMRRLTRQDTQLEGQGCSLLSSKEPSQGCSLQKSKDERKRSCAGWI